MKIVTLNLEKGWRGGERQTILYTLGLLEKGYTVEIVCRSSSLLEKKAKEENIVSHSFRSNFSTLLFLITKGYKYDILHAQGSKVLTYCILSKPFHRAKIIFTRRVNFKPKGILTKIKYKLCDRIVAISSSIQTIVSEFSSRNDVVIISDIALDSPLDKSAIEENIKNINPDNKYIIGTIAALTSEKNPFDSIRAIKILKEKRDDFIFLHFGDGPLKKNMIEFINQLGIEKTYLLMGFTKNVNDYFKTMDVFIMASSNEGLCSSVLDSFIYRVPVVSTTAGGLGDLIKEDRAIRCEVNNPNMIADGIDSILNTPEKASDRVNNAYQYAIKNHGIEYITNQYIELINEICPK